MTQKTRNIVHIVVMSALAAGLQIFVCLCYPELGLRWSHPAALASVLVASALNLLVLVVDIVAYFRQKEIVYKLCLVAYVLLLFVVLVLFVLLKTGFWEIASDESLLEDYLKRAGKWMVPLFIVLQFLQVVILPIPSTITVAAGSVLFGPLLGSVYSLIGIIVGSLVAFLIGRFAGYRVVSWLVGGETLDEWLKKVKGKDKLFLSAMFILPVFPDDVLCFVAGLSSMSVWFFLIVIVISRILSVFTTSYSISLIPFDTWWGLLIWAILFAAVVALFVLLYKKGDAVLAWLERKLRRPSRVERTKKDEFTVEIVDPDGTIVRKGVKKSEGETQEPTDGDDSGKNVSSV